MKKHTFIINGVLETIHTIDGKEMILQMEKRADDNDNYEWGEQQTQSRTSQTHAKQHVNQNDTNDL